MRDLSSAEVSQKEREFLDLTHLTLEEFALLVPTFEEAVQSLHDQHFSHDGQNANLINTYIS